MNFYLPAEGLEHIRTREYSILSPARLPGPPRPPDINSGRQVGM